MGMIITLADVMQGMLESAKDAVKKSTIKSEERSDANSRTQSGPNGRASNEARFAKPTLRIHGGSNLMQTVATARRFIFRKGIPTTVHEYIQGSNADKQWQPTWEDHNICVWAMPVSPEITPTQSDVRSTTIPELASPLKRSFNQYAEEDHEQHQRGKILEGIIGHMFNSDWRLDALFETPLAEVKMPATIFVRNSETKEIERYSGPMPGGEKPLPDVTVLVRKPWPGALVAELPSTEPSPVSMCYIIRNRPQRGKFDPVAATKFGVPKGPLFRQLSEGKSVLNKKGETVLPEQVLGPGKPGGGFAVVDLPSPAYVEDLINRPEWKVGEVMLGVEAVIWNLGTGVAEDIRLQKFISGLSSLKHVISSPEYCANYLTMDSASAAAVRHNMIDPDRFPIPLHDNGNRALPDALSTCTMAHRGITIDLEPEVVIQKPPVPSLLNTAEVMKCLPKHVKKAAERGGDKLNATSIDFNTEQDLPSPDAEIISLGTGSALPSKYRNVSSTLVRVPGIGSYLLDCGENTLGQLSRLYSAEQLSEMLQDLRLIWISHMHADHHLGLTAVIKAWCVANYGKTENCTADTQHHSRNLYGDLMEQKRLFVAAEPAMTHWLREYSQIEDFGYDKLVPLDVYAAKSKSPTKLIYNRTPVSFDRGDPAVSEAMRTATGLSQFAAVDVTHCHGAKAVSLTFPTGFKVSYSGDCRPSKSFVEIGQDSTVLIHEATFDDKLQGDAIAKNHCTISEAIGVGHAMRARRVILTHFSQRYQKLPRLGGGGMRWDLQFAEPTVEQGLESAASASTESMDIDSVPARETDKSMDAELETVHIEPGNGTNRQNSRGDMKVAVAFDLMRIKVKDIASQESFAPAFVKLYEESPDKLDAAIQPSEARSRGGSPKKDPQSKQSAKAKAKAEKKRLRNKQSAESMSNGRPGSQQGKQEPASSTKAAGATPATSGEMPEPSSPKAEASSSSVVASPPARERRLGGRAVDDFSSCSDEEAARQDKKRRMSEKWNRRQAKIQQLKELRAKNAAERAPQLGNEERVRPLQKAAGS